MPLRRITSQKRNSLREFYFEMTEDSHRHVAEAGKKMIALLDDLEAALGAFDVWAVTSHYELKLLPADGGDAPWLISIQPPVSGSFAVDYLLPTEEAPWPDARVRGETDDVSATVQMILAGIRNSRGWISK